MLLDIIDKENMWHLLHSSTYRLSGQFYENCCPWKFQTRKEMQIVYIYFIMVIFHDPATLALQFDIHCELLEVALFLLDTCIKVRPHESLLGLSATNLHDCQLLLLYTSHFIFWKPCDISSPTVECRMIQIVQSQSVNYEFLFWKNDKLPYVNRKWNMFVISFHEVFCEQQNWLPIYFGCCIWIYKINHCSVCRKKSFGYSVSNWSEVKS